MSRKKWTVKSFDKEKASAIAEELGISPYAALLASARGINTADEAREFFGFSEADEVDPFDFPDMASAVERIKTALDECERIAVYGDYDCDGVTATCLLYSYLEMQGADVVYCVPNRHTEGYGLNFAAIDKLSRMGVSLIITVDNGISSVEEAEYINQLEMEIIVTDHHLPSDTLPRAVAVVDPHREDCTLKFKDYAGVGVAYKLVCALEGEENEITESLLDLAAIGTVADVMPLYAENRSIVRRGTQLLNECERPGLVALMEAAGLGEKTVTSGSIAFAIAPRINAAGRIDTADRAIQLLLCDDYDEAAELAQDICSDNAIRQKTEQEILSDALAQINANPDRQYDSVLVVSGEGWHDGVIGIVASRLMELYGKPSIVITVDGDTAKGSGRSFDGFSLYDALCSCSEVLTHFGGHTLAAGLGLESVRIDELRTAINAYADTLDMPFPTQSIDFKINPAFVTAELLDTIEMLEPFGAGNPQPVFGLYNMTVSKITPIGSGKHLRLTLTRDGTAISAVKFKATQLDFPFDVGDTVDVAALIEPNDYMGQRGISVLIRNIKLHNMDEDELLRQMKKFSALMGGKRGDYSALVPDRTFTARAYKYIRGCEVWRYDSETLCSRLGLTASSYAMLSVAVQALVELQLLVRGSDGSLSLPETSEKVSLDDAPIYEKIRSLKW